MPQPTVAILGASTDRSKFGNKSVRAHQAQGYTVYPVNPKADQIEGLKAYPSLSDVPVEMLDRISVYLPPSVGIKVLDELAAHPAREIWFNPGTDSPELIERAASLGLTIIRGCSIVDLGVSPAQFPDS